MIMIETVVREDAIDAAVMEMYRCKSASLLRCLSDDINAIDEVMRGGRIVTIYGPIVNCMLLYCAAFLSM